MLVPMSPGIQQPCLLYSCVQVKNSHTLPYDVILCGLSSPLVTTARRFLLSSCCPRCCCRMDGFCRRLIAKLLLVGASLLALFIRRSLSCCYAALSRNVTSTKTESRKVALAQRLVCRFAGLGCLAVRRFGGVVVGAFVYF